MSMFGLKEPPDDKAMVDVPRGLDADGQRVAKALLATFDQLYYCEYEGLLRLDQPSQAEMTHLRTLAEINLRGVMWFDGSEVLDFSTAVHEVDCEYYHGGAGMPSGRGLRSNRLGHAG